jgi:hypothetical protein
MSYEIKVGQGARRTETVTVVEDDGSLAPLASVTASAPGGWTATGSVQSPNTSAKLVVGGSLTATMGRYTMTVTPTLVDGDIEPIKVTVVVV